MPGTAVYRVQSCWMAAIAASLMCCGVEKCGSPAPNSTRSAPAAFSLAASATTAIVADTSMRLIRSLNCLTAVRVAILYLFSNSSCCAVKFLAQPGFHELRNQAAHRAAQPKDLLHQFRTQVRVGLGGHHEDRFQLRLQLAVHQRHLQLVLVVADGAYAAQHRFGFLLHGVVHQQAFEGVDAHVLVALDHLFEHLPAFDDGEQRVLLNVAQNGHDELVKDLAATLDQVEMPVGERVKRARINGADQVQMGFLDRKMPLNLDSKPD